MAVISVSQTESGAGGESRLLHYTPVSGPVRDISCSERGYLLVSMADQEGGSLATPLTQVDQEKSAESNTAGITGQEESAPGPLDPTIAIGVGYPVVSDAAIDPAGDVRERPFSSRSDALI